MGLTELLKLVNWQGWLGISTTLILSVFLLIQTGEKRHYEKQSTRYEQLYEQEHLAFGQTVLNYRQAADKARADDAANKARVEAEQTAINQKKDAEYEARIADARARAERLSHEQAGTNPRGPGVAPVPGVSASTGGPDGASTQAGLSVDDKLTATEQAIQLDELEKWIAEQHSVDVNGKK